MLSQPPITPDRWKSWLLRARVWCWYWYRAVTASLDTRGRHCDPDWRQDHYNNNSSSLQRKGAILYNDSDCEARRGGIKCTGGLSGEREMILDLESWNNSDNVFLGATPADQDDGAGAEADGEIHAGHQPQALQARGHDQCCPKCLCYFIYLQSDGAVISAVIFIVIIIILVILLVTEIKEGSWSEQPPGSSGQGNCRGHGEILKIIRECQKQEERWFL